MPTIDIYITQLSLVNNHCCCHFQYSPNTSGFHVLLKYWLSDLRIQHIVHQQLKSKRKYFAFVLQFHLVRIIPYFFNCSFSCLNHHIFYDNRQSQVLQKSFFSNRKCTEATYSVLVKNSVYFIPTESSRIRLAYITNNLHTVWQPEMRTAGFLCMSTIYYRCFSNHFLRKSSLYRHGVLCSNRRKPYGP